MKSFFIRIPKCASSSIVNGLSNHPGFSYTGGLACSFWGDSPLDNTDQSILNFIDLSQHDFTFSCVRNPWDRVVSAYQNGGWNLPQERERCPTFADCIEAMRTNNFPTQTSLASKWHLTPAARHLYRDDKQAVDFIMKFENLQEDFDTACQTLGIDPHTIRHDNATEHKPYREYYTEDSRNVVAEYYQEDIDRFGYKF
jgi:hypothetical protein